MHTFAHLSFVAASMFAMAMPMTQAMGQEGKPAGEPIDPLADLTSMNTNHVRVFLLHKYGFISPAETTTLAIHFVIDPEWHMYWNGYAEDGMEPTWELQLPVGLEVAGDVVWPIPHRHEQSEFVVEHIYEKQLTLLVPIRVADDAKPGDYTIGIKAKWLVCSDRCVPESGEDSITLRVGSEHPAKSLVEALDRASADESGRPSQSAAKKIIEDARLSQGNLQWLTGPRAKELGISATLVQDAGTATLQLRGNDKVTSMTWFPSNQCAHPTSEFAAWTIEGASLDIPLDIAHATTLDQANDSTTPAAPGKTPETTKNHTNSVCVRGILHVKTRDGKHNDGEYFDIQVKADAGKSPG